MARYRFDSRVARRLILCSALPILALPILALPILAAGAEQNTVHDLVIHHGVVYDGSGQPGKPGEVAIDGDRISYVGPEKGLQGRREIDAKGQAIAPGFVNMLAHPEESFFADG